MRKFRLNGKKIRIGLVLILQIFLISTYFLLQNDTVKFEKRSKISFVNQNNATIKSVVTYQTSPNEVHLINLHTSQLYVDFNSSLCYKTGTDLKQMHGSGLNWKCKCLHGWHGNDCGQPEIIWRALLAYRKPMQLHGPRKKQRKIIYFLAADEISLINTEIIVNELNLVVDLFILYKVSTYLNPKLRNILYLNVPDFNYALTAVKSISNIRSDDIIVDGGVNEIPNSLALQFLKLYDEWPQPVQFRYRWNVYGFFWMHPSKTIVKSRATTVSFMYESINANNALIVGDLNHFGGWFCQFCYESNRIIDLIINKPTVVKLNTKDNIDKDYIEDLIENGIYLDGKTELIRTRRYLDYYAPDFIVNNSWKYDWLFINLYSKLDYD